MLARQFLWQAAITYNHGTGHGVGAFLGVHEGPIGISPRYPTPLEPGMIISNEPGYYKSGAYGIRIENLVLVVESEVGEGKYLEFETLTLAPIDLRLIDESAAAAARARLAQRLPPRVFKEIGPSAEGRGEGVAEGGDAGDLGASSRPATARSGAGLGVKPPHPAFGHLLPQGRKGTRRRFG